MRIGPTLSRGLLLPAVCLLAAACSQPPQAPPTAALTAAPAPSPQPISGPGSGWELVWQDEFDGQTLNPANWIAETGAGGWGNNELQFYTDRPENVRLEDGLLVIEARQEDYRGSRYTSARLKTQYLQSWAYGRIEARMQLPTGQGVWSAFWMLGDDFPTAGWPHSGEIDIMENIGEPGRVYGTVHGPGYSGGAGVGSSYTLTGTAFPDAFHLFAVEWSPGEIRWYVDEALFGRVSPADVPGPWVYDHPFFIILNVAVGGNWPGEPDAATSFPQRLRVDYVRVYRDRGLDLEALQSAAVHVREITLALEEAGGRWQGTAYVTVVDQNSRPVEGVVVTAGWLGVVSGATAQASTGPDGRAGPFVGLKTSSAREITFCIAELAGTAHKYDKGANVQTCAFGSP